MTTLITLVLVAIFTFLSGLHVYWAFGGKWASDAVIPTRNTEEKAIMPGVMTTLFVAAGLLCFAIIIILNVVDININLPNWVIPLRTYGLWLISFIFILRAIGDFKYLGFFKKIKNTAFGKNDTNYFSPLCLMIGLMTLTLALIN